MPEIVDRFEIQLYYTMSTKINYEVLSLNERQTRYFSDGFKRKKVKEIEDKLVTVSEVSREYHVARNAVYKWIYKYSAHRKRGERKIVELMSDTRKITQLKDRIKALEQALGQKQMLLDFNEKLVELASEEVGFDIKKKYTSKPNISSGKTESS